jgi:hypothetical protein
MAIFINLIKPVNPYMYYRFPERFRNREIRQLHLFKGLQKTEQLAELLIKDA